MLEKALTSLVTSTTLALFEELWNLFRSAKSKEEAASKLRTMLKRRAHEATHDAIARELNARS